MIKHGHTWSGEARTNRDAKNARKRARHAARREAVAAELAVKPRRSPLEQIAILDARLGVGRGAKRERAKLAERIRKQEKK